jgi:protein SCO1/2
MAEPRRLLAVGVAAVLLATACDTDSGGGSDTGSDVGGTTPTAQASDAPATTELADRELAGIVRSPAPEVDATAVPSLTNPGEAAVFRAEPGGFLAIYFGYTNCPDVCPTTMADWAVAMRRLPPELADSVGTLMVTVDPGRDNEVLPGYVTSFVADAEAAGTTDADLLAAAAEPFGVSYDVVTTDDGEIEVSHTGFLYLVDDQGHLRVTWPFGLSSRDMAADVEQLFEAEGSA